MGARQAHCSHSICLHPALPLPPLPFLGCTAVVVVVAVGVRMVLFGVDAGGDVAAGAVVVVVVDVGAGVVIAAVVRADAVVSAEPFDVPLR